MKTTEATVTLNLIEIELLLNIWVPRELQNLGPHMDSARRKLQKARAEILAQGDLFADREKRL